MSSVESVLFVCHGNTCRSVMAEKILRRLGPKDLKIDSAGISPGNSEVAEYAILALERLFSLKEAVHIPKSIEDVRPIDFDLIIVMDKWVANNLPPLPGKEVRNWDIQDPYGDNYIEYQRTAIILEQKINGLLSEIGSDA